MNPDSLVTELRETAARDRRTSGSPQREAFIMKAAADKVEHLKRLLNLAFNTGNVINDIVQQIAHEIEDPLRGLRRIQVANDRIRSKLREELGHEVGVT